MASDEHDDKTGTPDHDNSPAGPPGGGVTGLEGGDAGHPEGGSPDRLHGGTAGHHERGKRGRRPKKKRSLPVRILRGLFFTLGGILGFVVLLVAGVVIFLSTDYGKNFVVRKGIELGDKAMPGRLALQSAEIDWTSRIALNGFQLMTPEGEPVVSVDRVLLRYQLKDLLKGLVNVDEVRIERPVVALRYDEQGRLNLDRALPPPKDEPPKEPWDGRLPLDVDADGLKIVGGALSLADARKPEPVQVAFEQLMLEAAYHYRDTRHDVTVQPLTMALTAPKVGEARLETRATYSMEQGEEVIRLASLMAKAPGLELHGSGQIANFDAPRGEIKLAADPIAATFLKTFAPDLPVEGQVGLHMTARGDGQDKVVLDTVLDLPKGVVTLAGTLDLSGMDEAPTNLGYDLQLAARDVALDPLLTIEAPPLSPLGLRVHAQGRGLSPAAMDTRVQVQIDPLRYETYRFEGGTIAARIKDNVVTLEDSRIDSPYARLFAKGRIELDGMIDAEVRAEVDQLARIGDLVNQPIRGQATLTANASGAFQTPDIRYKLSARRFGFGPPKNQTVKLKALDASGDVVLARNEDGRIDPRVRVTATGDDLGASAVLLDRFTLKASWQQPVAEARLDAVDPRGRPLELGATARVGDREQVIEVAHLVAPLGTTAWRLKDDFSITVAPDRIHLTPFSIAGADGEVSGRGTFSQVGRNDLHLVAQNLNLRNVAPMMPDSLANLRGVIQLNADVTGPAAAPEVKTLLELRGLAARSIPELSGNLRLTTEGAAGERTALQTDLFFQDGGAVITRVNVPMPLSLQGMPDVPDDMPLGGMVRLQNFNLGIVAALSGGEGMEHLGGRMSAYLHLEGTRGDPRMLLDVVGDDVTVRSKREIDATLRLAFADQRLNMTGTITNPEVRDQALINAKLDVPIEVTRNLEVRPSLDKPIDGSIRIDAREARSLAPLLPELERVKGLVALDFAATGSLGDPIIKAQMRARQIQVQAYPSTDMDLEMGYGDGVAAAITRIMVAGEEPVVAEARVDTPLGETLRGGPFVMRDLKAAVNIDRFDLMKLPPAIRGPQLKSGELSVKGTFASNGPVPTLDLVASIVDLGVSKQDSLNVSVAGGYEDDALRLTARVTEGRKLQADVQGRIPLELRLPIGGAGETVVEFRPGMDIKANIPGLDISLANAFLPNRATVDGTLRGQASIRGALDAPLVRGSLELQNAEVYLPSEGVFYDKIKMLARFSEQEIVLEEALLRGGRGRLKIEGNLKMENGTPGPMDVTARFERFEAMDGPLGRAILDGNLQVAGTATAPSILGEVTIPQAVIKLPDFTSSVIQRVAGLEPGKQIAPTELPPSVVVLTRDGVVPWQSYVTGEQKEEAETVDQESAVAYDANIKIHVPRDFWIQNEAQEVVAEVKGDVTFIAENGNPRMVGKVETVRGEIRLFSQELEITEGAIVFTGGAEINPRLEVVATARTEDYGEVGMRVTGPATEPELEFFSDEGYETADVLSILIIGKPLSESNPRESQQMQDRLESIAAGALSGWVRKQLAGRLPIDYLRIEATSFNSFDLRVGKYVTPKLFIIYRRRIGESDTTEQQNVNEARAEYQIGRNLYVETFYGDANVWGGELFWRRYY